MQELTASFPLQMSLGRKVGRQAKDWLSPSRCSQEDLGFIDIKCLSAASFCPMERWLGKVRHAGVADPTWTPDSRTSLRGGSQLGTLACPLGCTADNFGRPTWCQPGTPHQRSTWGKWACPVCVQSPWASLPPHNSLGPGRAAHGEVDKEMFKHKLWKCNLIF